MEPGFYPRCFRRYKWNIMKVPEERFISKSQLCNWVLGTCLCQVLVFLSSHVDVLCLLGYVCEGSIMAVAAMRTWEKALRSLHSHLCVLSSSLVPCWVVFVGPELLRSRLVNPYLRYPWFPSGFCMMGPNSAFSFADFIICRLTKEDNAAVFWS